MAGDGNQRVGLLLPGETRGQEAENRCMLDFNMVCVYLYTIIIELSIKALWLLENRGQELRKSHDVTGFFNGPMRGDVGSRWEERVYGDTVSKLLPQPAGFRFGTNQRSPLVNTCAAATPCFCTEGVPGRA